MKRSIDLYWPFIGLILAIPYYFGFFRINNIGLDVISILFGGLLALLLLIPAIENFRQIKNIKATGHIQDLIYYIRLPLTLSVIFILVEFFSSSFLKSISELPIHILGSIYFGLWGVFFLALLRLITIIPHMIYNKSSNES